MMISSASREPLPILADEAIAAGDDLCTWAAPFGVALLETIKLLPGIHALDIGCGTGFPLLELASRLGPLGQVTGLDPSGPALDRTRAKAAARGISNLRFVEAGAEAMPFEDRSFDLLVSNNGLNNVQDAAKALAECARVARTRAQLVLTANLPGTFALFYELFEMLLEDRGMKDGIAALHAHIHGKRRTVEAWTALVEAAGFEPRKVREGAFTWSFLNGTALFQHWMIRLAFMPPWVALLPPDQAPAFMAFFEGRLNRLALERGGLHLEVPFLCLDALRA
ncbi:MAG TPA: methyltransferase domain-containing protein [Holophaga sp.]|nr:methyltransferase domain-containing protein [Holophaga sp.]